MTFRARYAVRAVAVACIIGSGCRCTGTDQSASTRAHDDSVHALLLRELNSELARSEVPDSLDQQRVTFTSDASAAVPSLMYHRAVFRSRRVTHSVASAVVGIRGGRVRVIKTPSDWAYLVAGWSAADSTHALKACLELIGVTRGQSSTVLPTYYQPGQAFPGYVGGDSDFIALHIRDRLTVSTAGATWHIEGWVADPALTVLAHKYDCRVPATALGADSVRLAVIDSLPRPRLGQGS